jgi:hypothetical protein
MSTSKTIYQLKVTLNDSKPPIWRRILVADTTTLLQLHDILQIVMGWADYHLHMFTISGQIYGDPEGDEFGDMGTKNESRFKLNQLVGREGFKFRYEYDFGDSWLHDLLVEKILPAENGARYPLCVAGKNACPPEDVGGIGGYANFLEAMTNPRHPEHREYKEWIGGNFDSGRFDLDEVNNGLCHSRRRDETDEQGFYEPPQSDGQNLAKIPTWANELNKEQLAWVESLAVRRDMVTFLSYLNDNRIIGTPSTGNLPLKAVREICAKFVNPPVLDEKHGDKVYKLRSEDNVWPLFYLHMLANAGGMVSGGQARTWKATSEGKSFLNASAPIQLGFMLAVWWHRADWTAAFPVSGLSRGLPRGFKEITLKHLLELPTGKSVSFETFADNLVKETHMVWPIVDQILANKILYSAIERIVVLPLVGFGILESEYGMEDIGGSKFSKLSQICLASFGKGLLETL